MTTSDSPAGGTPPDSVIGRRAGVAVAVALVFGNLANYAFQVVSGRALSVEDYGSLAGYLAVITVITVSTSALQTMAALTVAAGENDPIRHVILDGLTRSAFVWGALVTVAVALLSPLLGTVTSFGMVPIALLGVYVLPAALDSIAAGRLLGARRFTSLAGYSTGQAVGKLAVLFAALAVGATVTGLLAAIILSSAVVAIVGRLISPEVGAINGHVLGSESRRAFAAITLFWVMISVDVPIAHARFDEHAAGVYAVGAVLAKAVLWIPITVSQLVFPTLSDQSSDDAQRASVFRKAAIIIAAIAVLSVLGLMVFGRPLYSLLYGDRYDGASTVAWKIGLAMLPMAMVNLAMFHQLANRQGRFVGVFAGGAGALIVGLMVVAPNAPTFALTLGLVGIAVLGAMLLLRSERQPGSSSRREIAHR